MKATEKQIENAILEYLSYKPGFFWKNQSVGVYDPQKKVFRKAWGKHQINGVSDILGVLPCGTFVAIEVKTSKGRLTDNQKHFISIILDNNAIAFVARSIKDVEEHLNDYWRKNADCN